MACKNRERNEKMKGVKKIPMRKMKSSKGK